MIKSIYTKDALGPLVSMPTELIDRCNSLANYNITALAGILFFIPVLEEAKTILEIGTGWCLSTIAFACASRINKGRVLSFDLYNRDKRLSNYQDLLPYITQIKVDSHNRDEALKIIKENNFESVDLLFIDGDHTYEGVKRDFEFYSQFLSENGIVLMHDISLNDPGHGVDSIEVCKFWAEIDETKYCKFPIYASNGLGIMRKR